VTPLVGGYIADTYLGRYSTILIFCCIYLAGLVMTVIATVPGNESVALFFPAIYMIAIGTGGIKPNVSTMGADQFDHRYAQDRKEGESYFNYFYWSINLGALIAYLGIGELLYSSFLILAPHFHSLSHSHNQQHTSAKMASTALEATRGHFSSAMRYRLLRCSARS
jgi:dipeptide/tripeptide permease